MEQLLKQTIKHILANFGFELRRKRRVSEMPIMDALAYLHDLMLNETCVRKLVAESSDGVFAFDVRDMIVGWHVGLRGNWEKVETEFLKQIVQEGDRVIDVGANLGWFTVVLAKLVGSRGEVIAFEPEPRNYSLLCENVQMNAVEKQVRLFQLALADENSDVRLELCDDNWGNHRMRSDRKPASAGEKGFSRVCTVPARTLDESLAEKGGPATSFRLLKIDCEGAEVAVFRGAKRTLTNTEYLLSEYYPAAMERAGFDAGEFRELVKPHFSSFSRLGGQGFDYDPKKHFDGVEFRAISQLEDDIHKPFNSLNYTQYLFRK